jgi:DNA primase
VFGLADQIAEEHLNRVRVKDEFISAACPFHAGGQERHPSFWVNRTTGKWGCFACQAGGSDLKYLLRELGISNLKVEAELEEAKEDAKKAIQLSEAKRKKKARASFKGVHVLPESLLGVFDYMPVDLVNEGFPEELLETHDIGFDKRNNRITFPVRDVFGTLVGISGRSTFPGESPKYLLYNGRRRYGNREDLGELGMWFPGYSNDGVRDHLWRVHLVHDDLMSGRWDQLIVVEGFKAAMWLVMMGTKMTEAQERLIRRFGATVFIFTDNNDPGREAAQNWCQRLAVSTFPVHRVHYPDYCEETAQPDDLNEEELDEVLCNSERVGGRYGKRMERKPKRGLTEKQWRK